MPRFLRERHEYKKSGSLSSEKYIELLQLFCSWPSAVLRAHSAAWPFKRGFNS